MIKCLTHSNTACGQPVGGWLANAPPPHFSGTVRQLTSIGTQQSAFPSPLNRLGCQVGHLASSYQSKQD